MPTLKDWQTKVDQHKRVRRFDWSVFSNDARRRFALSSEPTGINRFIPSALEVILALLLAALMVGAWFAWAHS
jgi:hypothetical protein